MKTPTNTEITLQARTDLFKFEKVDYSAKLIKLLFDINQDKTAFLKSIGKRNLTEKELDTLAEFEKLITDITAEIDKHLNF